MRNLKNTSKETKKYSSRDKRGMSHIYSVWKSMLKRCKSNKNYLDCIVCEEWQDFQVFADWYTKHDFYGLGYDLDKDILIKGNKIYSPTTCCLIPRVLNQVFKNHVKPRKHMLPLGVSYNKRNAHKKYGASLSLYGERKHLGYFKTPEEASAVYVKAKESYVKDLALEWKDKIEPRAFDALMNWTVY